MPEQWKPVAPLSTCLSFRPTRIFKLSSLNHQLSLKAAGPSEGSFGLIPDVAHDIDVFTNWDQHSGADQAGALLDVAGMAPIPGGKFFAEGFEHGADALGAAARHADDVPHADVPHQSIQDIGEVASSRLEDAGALLAASEASGGHLLERHVGQIAGAAPGHIDDLSSRLDADPRPLAVSTFATTEEAQTALSAAFQHHRTAIDTWLAQGATENLKISVPFVGGEVLARGATTTVSGTSEFFVLKGVGDGR
ncbi:RNase A-like domain-containing protein [Mycolicibacterium vaccae]|uniref:RNase A-like domain-containing protein n=1 Tax=Mycolicibacterium vaccae TaxID=1810 RepID=UPI003CEE0961